MTDEKKIELKVLRIKAKYLNLIQNALDKQLGNTYYEYPMQIRYFDIKFLCENCEQEINSFKNKHKKNIKSC